MTTLTLLDLGLGSTALQYHGTRELLESLGAEAQVSTVPAPGLCLTEDGRLLDPADPAITLRRILPLGMLTAAPAGGNGIFFSESQVRGALLPYVKSLSEQSPQPIQPLSLDPITRMGQLSRAGAVCSDCYCDVMMALAMGKPFFTALTREDRDDLASSAIYALLERLGAADRCIWMADTARPDAPISPAVAEAVAAWRDYSLSCLKAYLSGGELPAPLSEGRKRKLPDLCAPSRCTGCAACTSICPMWAVKQRPAELGFLRPDVGMDCTLCRNCQKFCPELEREHTPLAPLQEAAAYTARADYIKERSAGGVFGVLAKYVLGQGGLVVGASLCGDGAVRHVAAQTEEELRPLLGAKYVQSDVSGALRVLSPALGRGRLVLFVGTPCQVDGLLHTLHGGRPNLITCDLACSGEAAPALLDAWRTAHPDYADNEAMANLFRDWESFRRSSYGKAITRGLAFRDACYECPFAGARRVGDLTLCSLNGTDTPPARTEEDSSIVLVNTDQGEQVWNRVAGLCSAVPVRWDEVLRCVPALSAPVAQPAAAAPFRSALAAWPFGEVEATFLK